MDKEKLIKRIKSDKIDLVNIPSTATDQERQRIIRDFVKILERSKSNGEAILLFIRP